MSAMTLIVGGAGFVGRALTVRLLDLGHTVHVLSRRSCPFTAHPRLHYSQGDLTQFATLRSLLDQCRNIVYLASETVPAQTARSPSEEIARNLAPIAFLVELLEQTQPKNLIYASSGGTVYGNPAAAPVAETAPLHPVSYHGAAKIAAEQLLSVLAVHTGHHVTILRPSNLYGPGQPYKAHFGVIRKLLQHARDSRTVEIWGDGTQIRDYLFIDDFVAACIALLDRPEQSRNPQILNVGAGTGTSLNDLCALVESTCGRRLETQCLPARSGDVKDVVLDISALKSEIRWSPETPIELGLARTWAWVQEGLDA